MKKSMVWLATVFTLLFSFNPLFAAEKTVDPLVAKLQTRWAEIKYTLPEQQREKAFAGLVEEAGRAAAAHPGDATFLIWEGIIRATYAGAKGGLGALGEVKKAKALFEQAIAIDAAAMNGSAYTSLGSLYYQVPGWPVGFGDDETAEEMLKKGLALNPDGIDSNYFYGDFLLDQGRYDDALQAFEKAAQAAPRPGRELADKGRKAEIQEGILKVRKKIGKR